MRYPYRAVILRPALDDDYVIDPRRLIAYWRTTLVQVGYRRRRKS